MKTALYKIKDPVIGPEIRFGSLFKSAIAARGIPKFETGPQKCVVNKYLKFSLLKIFAYKGVLVNTVEVLLDIFDGQLSKIVITR